MRTGRIVLVALLAISVGGFVFAAQGKLSPNASAEEKPEASTAGSRNSVSGQMEQRQQSAKDQDRERLRNYMTKLVMRLRGNLVYPKEMENKGITGISLITFTITKSGQVKEGSLQVRTSSGYPELDASALEAVRASAPFEPPLTEMRVEFPVRFLIKGWYLPKQQQRQVPIPASKPAAD